MAFLRGRKCGTSRTPSPTGGQGRPPLHSARKSPCRAGPMCPTAGCALTPAGHTGPALRDSSASCCSGGQGVVPTMRDVEDAVPYGRTGSSLHSARKSHCRAGPMCPAAGCALTPAGHTDPALRDSSASRCSGGQRRPPLRCGTSRTPSPTGGQGRPPYTVQGNPPVGRDLCVPPRDAR